MHQVTIWTYGPEPVIDKYVWNILLALGNHQQFTEVMLDRLKDRFVWLCF